MTPPPSQTRAELEERVARAIHNSTPVSSDPEMNDACFSGSLFDDRMKQARAAIAIVGEACALIAEPFSDGLYSADAIRTLTQEPKP